MDAPDFDELSDLEVFARWTETMRELKRRGLIRSLGSNPLGGYAEALVARHYGTEPEVGRDKGYDVVRPDSGATVQVKGRRYARGSSTTHFGEFDLFAERRFNEFVGVVFDEDFTVRSAWHMPWETVDRLAATVRGKRRLYIRDVEKAIAAGDETITELQLDQKDMSPPDES
jgi:hypothetical protein